MKVFASLILILAAAAAFAGDFRPFAVSDVSSMQIREDGQYNVVCLNGTFEVVSAEDVAEHNVCPYVKPAQVILSEGMYHPDEAHSSYCEQAAHVTMEHRQLDSIRLEYPSCHGEFLAAECSGNVCKGVSGGQEIEVTVINSTQYQWNNLSHNVIVQFYRAGDLPTKAVLAEMQKKKKSKSKIAGQ